MKDYVAHIVIDVPYRAKNDTQAHERAVAITDDLEAAAADAKMRRYVGVSADWSIDLDCWEAAP